eukprot:gene13574-19447_t
MLPTETPTKYRTLVEQCFDPETEARPTLNGLLDELSSIQNQLCGKLGSDSPCRVLTRGLSVEAAVVMMDEVEEAKPTELPSALLATQLLQEFNNVANVEFPLPRGHSQDLPPLDPPMLKAPKDSLLGSHPALACGTASISPLSALLTAYGLA